MLSRDVRISSRRSNRRGVFRAQARRIRVRTDGVAFARFVRVHTMISLEELLDGLDVAVEPLATHAIRRDGSIDCGQMDGPAIHYALRGSGRLEIAAGETVGVSARTVIAVPPGHRARSVTPEAGRRRAASV